MLDEKTKELIAIGAAITANCQSCLEYHTGKAHEVGAQDAEILAAIDVGKLVRNGAAGKMNRYAARLIVSEADTSEAAGCGCAS
ncbi:MAG TPA: carboxymuconolactone decarboxylase family protein [Rhodocyclaceae bacterium]|nr:carboxymuconolactone decarboxylase family protein [Rhodocyclaceae bacterium]